MSRTPAGRPLRRVRAPALRRALGVARVRASLLLPLLLLMLPLLLPLGLAAQEPLRLAGGGESVEIAPVTDAGFVAYPTHALEAIGAVVRTRGGVADVTIDGDTLRFEAFSPFFEWAGNVAQLATPVHRDGDTWLWPRELFVDWLPVQYPARFSYADGRLRLAQGAPRLAAGPGARAEGGAPVLGQPIGRAPAGEPARTPVRAKPAPREAPAVPASPGPDEPLGRPTLGPRLVVIDPGHGGRDPGTISRTGVREKDIVLSIGRRLAAVLRDRGYDVRMTRTTDTLIALGDRPHIANQMKGTRQAALFMSIHANAHPSSAAEGFETYFLSEARTADERRVAELENAAAAYERESGGPGADAIDVILRGLRNDFYQHASNDLGEAVQRALAGVHPGSNRGVKQAPFRVLVGAAMPAVLVETAFLSNRAEARMLASAPFQERLARSLAEGVARFFDSHEHLWAAEPAR